MALYPFILNDNIGVNKDLIGDYFNINNNNQLASTNDRRNIRTTSSQNTNNNNYNNYNNYKPHSNLSILSAFPSTR